MVQETQQVATTAEPAAPARPWDAVWPSHVPRSLAYPRVSAAWILERNLARHADHTAILYLDHATGAELARFTYAELHAEAKALAGGLRALGLGPDSRVALFLPNCPELIAGYFGIWLAGAAVVPCNPMYRTQELAYQVRDAAVEAIITAPSLAAAAAPCAQELGVPLIVTGEPSAAAETGGLAYADVLARGRGERLDDVRVEPEDMAILLYTGGTTGVSKGAMLTHANIVANTIQFATWYAFEEGGERCIAALPLFHSGGFSGAMNVPLYSGATLLLFQRFAPLTVVQTIERHRATRFFGVPTMYIGVLNERACHGHDLSSLRACRTNAAPLPVSVKHAFDALVGHAVLVEGYGLSETSPLTHANPIHAARPGSIGIPLPDTDARIVDLATNADAPPGAEGELLLRGPQVMQGYWKKPAETAATLSADGWLRTGDIARMDADGYFYIVDRKKDLINTAGFKVWPREVEEVLYAHPAVKMAAVIGVPDAYRGEAVKAFVVPRDGSAPTEAELLAFCRERLASYKCPRAIELRAALPTSGAGKILRRLLREELATS
jgi:long-chain acyl-CoA synthetase